MFTSSPNKWPITAIRKHIRNSDDLRLDVYFDYVRTTIETYSDVFRSIAIIRSGSAEQTPNTQLKQQPADDWEQQMRRSDRALFETQTCWWCCPRYRLSVYPLPYSHKLTLYEMHRFIHTDAQCFQLFYFTIVNETNERKMSKLIIIEDAINHILIE